MYRSDLDTEKIGLKGKTVSEVMMKICEYEGDRSSVIELKCPL